LETNHKDGNRWNNQPGNLEYITPQENLLHSTRILGKKRGEEHCFARLTEKHVRLIRRLAGRRPQPQIAALFGVCRETVSDILNRHTWAHVV
jgi:hypothetical protein